MDMTEDPIRQFTVTYRGTVYPWQCDHMGYMNVMWYTAEFDEASWQLLAMFGLTRSHLRRYGVGTAAVEQRAGYPRELHAGDVVTIRSARAASMNENGATDRDADAVAGVQ